MFLMFHGHSGMQKIRVWIVLLLFWGMVVFSCQEDENILPGSSLLDEYYPLQEGDVRTYIVDSITYDYDGDLKKIVIDTLRYILQERVLESVQIQGEAWHRIGQYRADSKGGDFKLVDYVYERKAPGRLIRKEGNLTFIPLASPLVLYDEWNGTAYFDASATRRFVRGEVVKPYEDWNYIFLRKWDDLMVENKLYPDVLQINQRDTFSIQITTSNEKIPPEHQLFYNLANEYYARQTGLIEKEEYNLTSICASSHVDQFQAFCDTTTIFQNAERGYIFRKRLLSHE